MPGNLSIVGNAGVTVRHAPENKCIVLGEGEGLSGGFVLLDLKLNLCAHSFWWCNTDFLLKRQPGRRDRRPLDDFRNPFESTPEKPRSSSFSRTLCNAAWPTLCTACLLIPSSAPISL